MSELLDTVPVPIQTRVRAALWTIRDWNRAIRTARDMERFAGCPGRYEWELRFAREERVRRDMVVRALAYLREFAPLAQQNGLDPEAVYAELGGHELLVAEGPHVRAFRPVPEEGDDARL